MMMLREKIEQKREIIRQVLKAVPDARSSDVQESPQWIKVFGKREKVGGVLLGRVRKELGITPVENGRGKLPNTNKHGLTGVPDSHTPADDGLSELILEAVDADEGAKGVASQAALVMSFIVSCGGYKKALALVQQYGESLEKLLS